MLHFCHCRAEKTCSSITSLLLKSLPQPVKSINPSLLHSNHFNFKEGRSCSIFLPSFSILCLFQALCSLCKTLSDILVLANLHSTYVQHVGKPVCMSDRSLQLPGKCRGLLDWSVQRRWHPQSSQELYFLWFSPTPLAKNTCKLRSYHKNCRHLNPQNVGSISLTCLSHLLCL